MQVAHYKNVIRALVFLIMFFVTTNFCYGQPPSNTKWELTLNDEFNNTNTLDNNWAFQNGPSSHILCSRWRDNAKISDGILHLENKKEQRAGQEWTSASLSSKRLFTYGYYECKLKYGNSSALNNAFWLMSDVKHKDSTQFEIDINEGHYPNEIATNVHRHNPLPHTTNSRLLKMGSNGSNPEVSITLETPVVTKKIRLVINEFHHVSIAELRAFTFNKAGYPKLTDGSFLNENLALKATVKVNSILREQFPGKNAVDGNFNTRWVSDDNATPFTLTLEWDKPQFIGCLQWVSGYLEGRERVSPIADYVLQYWNGKDWIDIQKVIDGKTDLINTYHTYGFEWNEKDMIWYFDGQEIRREHNQFCKTEARIYLSSAIVNWAGPVTSKIDGTSMDIDYVRYYKRGK